MTFGNCDKCGNFVFINGITPCTHCGYIEKKEQDEEEYNITIYARYAKTGNKRYPDIPIELSSRATVRDIYEKLEWWFKKLDFVISSAGTELLDKEQLISNTGLSNKDIIDVLKIRKRKNI